MKKKIICQMILLFVISIKGFSQASFSIDVTAGCAPLCSNFTDQSVGALSWYWDFGDASTSTIQNPSHCYSNPGFYTITLTATFNSGTGTATGTVTVYSNPVAAFTSVNNGNNTISFTDQSTGAATWYWDFGDLTTPSTVQNPVHSYATSGSYSVLLYITSAAGCVDTSTLVVTPTGMDNLNRVIGWNIFPNPSNGQVTIHFDGTVNQEMIRVENTLGEIIFEKEISTDATIDFSNQPSGIYFVRIGNSLVKKMMIE